MISGYSCINIVKTYKFTRSTADFYTALESANFKRFRNSKDSYIKGLRIKSDFLEEIM